MPTEERPLGIDWPGLTSCTAPHDPTICEPNWVGHLVTKCRDAGQLLLVYDYAVSGDRVPGLKRQVDSQFMPHVGQRPTGAPWISEDTLFFTWIGMNDCGWNIRTLPDSNIKSIEDLFAIQDQLYEAGARNFCFMDVAPLHRFPRGPKGAKAHEAYASWNELLKAKAQGFSAKYPDVTVIIFPAWDLFSRILENPAVAGVSKPGNEGVEMLFVDGVHPTSAVHAKVADELEAVLLGVAPNVPYSGA